MQSSLFQPPSRQASVGRPYAWGPLEEIRFRVDRIVPVEMRSCRASEIAFVVARARNEDWRGILEAQQTAVEIQTFEESGVPLPCFTARLGTTAKRSGHVLSLLFDYQDLRERGQFELLARQSRVKVFVREPSGGPLGQRDLTLTLWNRVQVYQALEAASRLWRRVGAAPPPFMKVRSDWEARQIRALAPATPELRGSAHGALDRALP